MRVLTNVEQKNLVILYKKGNLQLPPELRKIVDGGFAIEKEVAKNSLLFISMNPSFKDKSWNNGENWGTNAIYIVPDLKDRKHKKETNSFFQAINRFYDELNCNQGIPPLAHHDLLFIRETNQETVIKWNDELKRIGNTFFSEQLNLSKKIIEESSPILIVVLNAGARDLFEEMFGKRSTKKFDDTLGAYMYNLNNERTTPVLFSGMLSGQRALDLGSKESLKWHIEHILKNIP